MITFVLSIVLAAQSTLVAESGFSSLNNSTHHLIDPTIELQVDEVLEDFETNQTRKASSLSLGFDDAAHWFIAPVENPTATTTWILEFEYPLLDFVDIYIVRSDGRVELTKIGDRFSFSERYFPSRFLHLPLNLQPGEKITLLWRIKTQTSLIAGARIAPEGMWTRSRSTEAHFKFFAYGLFFMLGSLQLILGLWTGDRSALLLSVLAGSAFLVTSSLDGLSSQLFEFLPTDFRKPLTLTSIAFTSAVLLQLISSLFNLSSLSPFRHKLLKFASIVYLLISATPFLIGYEVARAFPLLILAMCALFLENLVWANRQKLRVAFVTDAALICFIVPPLFSSQRYSGLLENSSLLDNINAIGMGLGFLAFSLAVADTMLMQRKERERLLTDIEKAQLALEELEAAKVHYQQDNLELNQEMKIASEQLTDADKMATLGTMMAGIIHDMNNPLQFISDLDQVYTEHHQQLKALLEALLGEATGDEADALRWSYENHFDTLTRSTQDLKLGTGKLKSLSAAIRNSARRDPSPAYHTLRPIVDECITILGSKLKLHTISCDIADDLSVYVTRSQLSQILINLLSNARDATQEKYERQGTLDYHPWIRITAAVLQGTQQGVLISIEDNGDGVPLEEVDSIFETFYTTKEVGIGTGLGLSIIKRLMTSHAGEIIVHDSELGGAQFDLYFPAAAKKEATFSLHEPQLDEAPKIA